MAHTPTFTIDEQARVDIIVANAVEQAQALQDAKDGLQDQIDRIELDVDINEKYMDNSVENLVEVVEAEGLVLDISAPLAAPHTFVRGDTFPVTPGSLGQITGSEDIDDWELRESVSGVVDSVGGSTLSVTDSSLSLTPGDYDGETLTFTSGVETGNSFLIATSTTDTFVADTTFGFSDILDDFDVTGTAPLSGQEVDGTTTVADDVIIDNSLSLIPGVVVGRDVKIKFTSGSEIGNSFDLVDNDATSVRGAPGIFVNVVATDSFTLLGIGVVAFSTTVNWVPTTEPTDSVIKFKDRWVDLDRQTNGGNGVKTQAITLNAAQSGIVQGMDDLITRTNIFAEDF